MTVEELNTDPPTEKFEVGARTVNLRPVIIPGPTTTMTPPDPPTQVITDLPTHTVVLPKVSTDPLDELVDRMRPALARAVDALQVAAALEADGFTDRVARVEYGFSDVFALALEVFRRLGPPTDHVADVVPTAHGWRDTVRMLAHGPLYLLPSAVFPAVLAVLGQRSVAIALTVASGLGWMYAGTAAYGAYRLLGAHRPRGAARVLRGATLAAPVAGALAGLGVVAVAGGGWGLVVMAACQLGYQLAGTVLVFYRREILQAASMVPAVLAGCGIPAGRPGAAAGGLGDRGGRRDRRVR